MARVEAVKLADCFGRLAPYGFLFSCGVLGLGSVRWVLGRRWKTHLVSRWSLPCGAPAVRGHGGPLGADCSRPHPYARFSAPAVRADSRALTRSQAPKGAVGASDRADSPREFLITWRTRRSRVPQRPQVMLDLVWRKLADGPTTGNLSGAGLASPPPLS